jgi:hypothetical protein
MAVTLRRGGQVSQGTSSTSGTRDTGALPVGATVITIRRVTIEMTGGRGWRGRDLVLYLVGVAGLAASLTVLFLGMRAVMDVGGYCAEGGPYVIDTHCPEGVALLIPVSIFTGLGSVALVGIKGSTLGGSWGALALLAWPALFISLGWNFLEYAFNPPGDDNGIVLGWLIPGVLFVIMGAFPLLAFLPGYRKRQPASVAPRHDAGAEGEARYASELKRTRRRLLNGLVQRVNRQAASSVSPAGPEGKTRDVDSPADVDLVGQLERLAKLYRSGSLTYDEYQRAKAAVIEGGGA